MTEVSISDVISFLGDRLQAVEGDDSATVGSVAPISPGEPGALSFAVAEKVDLGDALARTLSTAVLVDRPGVLAGDLPDGPADRAVQVVLVVESPRLEFARVTAAFFVRPREVGVHPSASVDPEAELGSECYVGPGAVIEADVVLGDRCTVGPNAVLLRGTSVGDDCWVGPNTTIGGVGFGYAREPDGTPVLLPHLGGVRIGDRVEIGANTAVDRGTLEHTVIEDDAKIDNLVHIAHNCVVGEGAFVIATSILCGSVRIGPRAWIAPNASVLEGISVGADATVGLAATVTRPVEPGVTVVGSPARPIG